MKELQVWRFLLAQLEQGHAAGLMIVVDSLGSSPGRKGFKMAVGGNGDMVGSIGGGIMEHKLVEYVRDRLAHNIPFWEVKRQIHSKEAAHDQSGMICSGEQTIAILQLTAQYRADVQRILDHLNAGEKISLEVDALGLVANDLTKKMGAQSADDSGLVAIDSSKAVRTDSNDALDLAAISKATGNQSIDFQQLESGGWHFHEVLGNWDVAHVIGAGHVGLEMCKILAGLDFFVVNYDDRPDLNTLQANDFAHRKVVTPYPDIHRYIKGGPKVYVIVMTFGYRGDDEAVRALLGQKFRYFGMMGSEAKVAKLLGDLRKDGYSETDIAEIRTPAGMVAHCQTPAEIAVSIAAEIIGVRNAHS